MSIETRRDNQALLSRIKNTDKLMRRILKAEVYLASKKTKFLRPP